MAKLLHSPEAEDALVGAALIDPATFATVEMASADFHDEQLGVIWRVGRELVTAGGHVDTVTIFNELESQGAGVTFSRLTHLTNECPNHLAASEYAATVRDLARRRASLQILQRSVRSLHRSNGTWADEVGQLAAELAQVAAAPARKSQPAPKVCWTTAELLAADFPEPQWAVPGLVPVGLSILAGRPKVGKSWLALQIAQAVGSGGMVLDQQIKAGKVLFLALEDSPRRLKQRLLKQQAPSGAAITFYTAWRRFDAGGLAKLRTAIEKNAFTLVIVDTLGRALGRADQSDWTDMTEIVGELQGFAINRDMAVLAVDHQRKPAGFAEDPVDDIIGSTAKSAVTDVALGLYRQQGKRGAILKATGRDVDEQQLSLSWDADLCCWQLEGTVEEVALRGRKSDILAALRGQHPEPLTATELAKHTEIKRQNVTPILNDLVNEGFVKRLPKVGKDVPHQLTERGLAGN
jgi:replicative DNA helicase